MNINNSQNGATLADEAPKQALDFPQFSLLPPKLQLIIFEIAYHDWLNIHGTMTLGYTYHKGSLKSSGFIIPRHERNAR